MMRKAVGWVMLSLALCGPQPAVADAALDRIKARGRLVVVVKNEGEQRQARGAERTPVNPHFLLLRAAGGNGRGEMGRPATTNDGD